MNPMNPKNSQQKGWSRTAMRKYRREDEFEHEEYRIGGPSFAHGELYSQNHRDPRQYKGRQWHSRRSEQASGSRQSNTAQSRRALPRRENYSKNLYNRRREGRYSRSHRTDQASRAVTQPRQAVQGESRNRESSSENLRIRRHEVQQVVTVENRRMNEEFCAEMNRDEETEGRQNNETLQMLAVSIQDQANSPVVYSTRSTYSTIQNDCVISCEGNPTNVTRSGYSALPKRDNDDTKWTLKHQAPNPNLKELFPTSAVYVDSGALDRSKYLANNSKELLARLLPEVFNKDALNTCSRAGKLPHLDKDAVEFLVKYVINHAENCGWPLVSAGDLKKHTMYIEEVSPRSIEITIEAVRKIVLRTKSN